MDKTGWRMAAAAGMWLAAGCAVRLERPTPPAVMAVPAPKGQPDLTYNLERYKEDLTAYRSGADAVGARNRMVYGLMAEIDYSFYEYETRMFLRQGVARVGSDVVQLGLAAGTTVTGAARTRTLLGALLSSTTGVALSVDRNLFEQQTVQAIASSMEAGRDRIKGEIVMRLQQDAGVYPFEAARADLVRYFFAGTLPAGLRGLHQQAAVEAQARQKGLSEAQAGAMGVGAAGRRP